MQYGPLAGTKVIEIAGIGPGPFCAMMLADMGADVLRIDRASGVMAGVQGAAAKDVLNRSRRSVAVDLKSSGGKALILDLVKQADALVEGFRPGVMERLGLGPEVCFAANQKLVYGRMTGWGQDGPWAHMAGHDINYIAIAGALHAFGRKGEQPTPPINMVGDFGGGGMLMAFGLVCGLLEAQKSGTGQVIDGAMLDGSALLMTMIHAFMAMGQWRDERGVNMLDTGAHFYDTYETADGKYLSIGAIEPQFYAEFLTKTGLGDDPDFAAQMDPRGWAALKPKVAACIKRKTRDAWAEIFDGTDACIAPVLSLTEAPKHPHNTARSTFVEIDGVVQAAPAPRYSKTPPATPRPPAVPGEHTLKALRDWGIAADEIDALQTSGAIVQKS
ncbi:MAG: CaiB/BaiF CoA-transferase family protein [Pseudomonadota bacterium]